MVDDIEFQQAQKQEKVDKITVRIIIEGKVQKVGLRNWIKQKANLLSVQGWVRNRANNTVEALFYGDEDVVNEIVNMCNQGPAFALIKRIKRFPESGLSNIPIEFTILPTV